MSAIAASMRAPRPLFDTVKGATSPYFSDIERLFKETISPVWGSQEKALEQIAEGTDRTTEVMIDRGNIVGLVIYKNELQEEYTALGVQRSLEVKALTIINPKENSGKGYHKNLLERVKSVARDKVARSVHLLVSKTTPEMRTFFLGQNFKVVVGFKNDSADLLQTPISIPIPIPGKPAPVPGAMDFMLPSSSSSKPSAHDPRSSYSTSSHEGARAGAGYAQTSYSASSHEGARAGAGYSSSLHEDTRTGSGSSATLSGSKRDYRTMESTTLSHRTPVTAMTLRKEYIHLIRSGSKTVEGRIHSGAFASTKVGNVMRFFYMQNASDDVHCRITHKNTYRSFGEMLKKEGYERCVPNARDLDDAVRIYLSIPGYAEKVQKYGCVALGLKVLTRDEIAALQAPPVPPSSASGSSYAPPASKVAKR